MSIDPEIQAGLLDPFVQATIDTLREMAACDAAPRSITCEATPQPRDDFTAALELLAARPGVLVLGMPRATAAALAERLLNESRVPMDDPLRRDAICELANVIAGQAKALTHGTPFTFNLGIPTSAGPKQMPTAYRIAWGTDLGDFTMWICRDR